MDEKEWLECTNPEPMVRFLTGKASDRGENGVRSFFSLKNRSGSQWILGMPRSPRPVADGLLYHALNRGEAD